MPIIRPARTIGRRKALDELKNLASECVLYSGESTIEEAKARAMASALVLEMLLLRLWLV